LRIAGPKTCVSLMARFWSKMFWLPAKIAPKLLFVPLMFASVSLFEM
jgi:hypothetical protein